MWTQHGPDIIATILHGSDLKGFRRTIVVGPNEYAVIVKGGQIRPVGLDITVTEGSYNVLTLGESVLSLFGMGPRKPCALWTNASPHKLEFWLGVEPANQELRESDPFRLPLLTKDGHEVPANVTVTLSVDPSQAHRLFNLPELQGKGVFTSRDLAQKLKNDVIAEVVNPEVEQHTLEEIRGNDQLRQQIRETLGKRLAETLSYYGLQLSGSACSIAWGLTEEESNRLEKRRMEWQEMLNPVAEQPGDTEPDKEQAESGEGNEWVNTGEIGGSVTVRQVTQVVGGKDSSFFTRSFITKLVLIFIEIGVATFAAWFVFFR